MMKKSILYILLALSPFFAVSCAKDGPDADGLGITLTVCTPDSGVTAEMKSMPDPRNGEDSYNENLLNSFYYFFFPKDAADQTPAVSGYVSGISETDMYKREIPVSSNTINNILFASERECQLFIVANPPASMVDDLKGTPTLAQLRAMTVLSALKTVPQSNFVMVYDGLIPVASRTQEEAVDVEVALKRLACKLTVGAYVTQSIEKNGKTYSPVTSGNGLKVTLCNGLNRTTLSGFKKSVIASGDYFDSKSIDIGYQGTGDLTENSVAVTYHRYSSSVPLYTYPMEWEFASETEPYLLYDLSWKVTDNTTGAIEYKSLYYKLTLGRRSIASNDWYNIAAKLTVLGSLYPEDPTEVYPYMNYQVQGWKNAYESGGANTPAAIKDTRYLSVPQTEWVLNNKDEIVIPFSSSHDCEVFNLKATKIDFSAGAQSEQNITSSVSYTGPTSDQITITHELNNELGPGMDISPITITFTLRHKDDYNFAQDITITQYPAIFVDTQLNSSGKTDTTNPKGYTYVNGKQNGDTWMTVLGANSGTTGDNTSRYFTVVHVSQFDPSTGYVVGDPRDIEINNLGSPRTDPWSGTGNYKPVNAPAKYNKDGQTGNRTIKYYYPTIDDGSRDNFVAPVFRISTAHTRSGRNDTYADIKKRCASYQEDGYPAGRWRVPTLAECKLSQVLSHNGMVPNIYINEGTRYYFYAGGWFAGNASQNPSDWHSGERSGGAATRCVYDEWYWSKVDEEFGWDNGGKYGETITTSTKTTFTWGDMPRDYVHKTN